MAKIKINVKEVDNKISNEEFNIDELVNMVNEKYECLNDENMDDYIGLEIDYNINHIVEQLKHIMKYYDLSTRRLRVTWCKS